MSRVPDGVLNHANLVKCPKCGVVCSSRGWLAFHLRVDHGEKK